MPLSTSIRPRRANRHGQLVRVLSLGLALGLVFTSLTVVPAAAASPVSRGAHTAPPDPRLVQLTGTINRHCNDGISLFRPEFQSTIYEYWSTAWSYSLTEQSEFPLGDYDFAIEKLREGISLIEGTPACNADEAKYKLDLLETLSWHIAFDVCRKHHQEEYVTTRDDIGDLVMLSDCDAFPVQQMQYWFQLASVDMIPASQSTCDPGYTEPPVGSLDGELYSALFDGFYTVLEFGGTIQDMLEDPEVGVMIVLINLTLDDLRRHDPEGGAGGSFTVEVVAHTTTDVTLLSGTVTSSDFGQGASLTLNPNVANITTVAALHHSIPVTVVGTLRLNGQAPVTVTIPNNSTYSWPYARGATYFPLDSTNLVDTQSADPSKNNGGRITALAPRSFQVAGLAGVPQNATAVTGNLTVKGPSVAGFLSLTNSSALPTVSTLNFPQGDTRANGVTVHLDSDGKLWVYYGPTAGATADFVFDVTGYYIEGAHGQRWVNLMTPYRLVDTRSTNGQSQNLGGKLTAGVPKSFHVTGLASPFPSIPAGATSVTGNLTVTQQSATGSISLTNSSAAPAVKTLHFPTGDNRAVGVTVKLDAAGQLWLTYNAAPGATTHVIFDITGYFTDNNTAAFYYPVTPVRTVDTRGGASGAQTLGGKLSALSSKSFQVAGYAWVPALNQPGAPVAAAGNLTVTRQTAAGYLSLTNSPGAPSVSTLNFLKGDNRANFAIVQLGGMSGLLYVYYGGVPAGNTTDVIYDLTGFFSTWSSY